MKRIYSLLCLSIAIVFGGLNCTWADEIALSENFDSGSLSTNGWTISNCHNSTDIYSSTSHSGNYSFRFYFNTNPPQYLISKELLIPSDASEVVISLYYKAHGSNYPESFKIGYSTTTKDVESFSWLPEITSITNTTWQHYTNNSLPAGIKYIAIAYTANDKWYFYIDDVEVSYSAPTSCPKPTALTKGTIDADNATFSWTAGGSESTWEYLCLEEGTTLSDAFWSSAETINTNSVTVIGLSGNTKYNFYVRAVCGSDDKSNPQSVSFTTPCGKQTSLSTYGFEDVASGSIPDCWSRIEYSGSPDVYEYSYYAHGGNKSLRFYGGGTNSSQIIVLPPFTNPSNLAISFWYYNGSTTTTYGQLQIGYMTDPSDASTFTTLAGGTLDRVGSYTYVEEFSLSGVLSAYVAIRFSGGTLDYGSAYIDDIQVSTATSCVKPTGLTASATSSSASISWTAGGTESSWRVQYSKDNWTNTSEVTVNTNPTCSLTGLTPATTYKVKVIAVCGSNDESDPVETTFTTSCVELPVPWSENFETLSVGSTTSAAPACWNMLNTNEGDYPYAYVASNSGYFNGTQSLYFQSSSTKYSYMILPAFDANTNDLKVSFYYRNEGISSSNGQITIGYMTNINDESSFTAVQTFERVSSLTKVNKVLFNDAPANARIAFRYGGSYTNNYFASIDDINVNYVLDCSKPQNVTVSDLTATGAHLSWNANDGVTSYAYRYVAHGSSPNWTGAPTTSNNYVDISGLTTGQEYDFYVKCVCGTEASDVISFIPICSAPANLTFGNKTSDGGRASWSADGSSAAHSVTGYEYCVVDFGTEPVWNATAVKYGTTTNQYVNISGLEPETNYTFYVRSICGSNIYSEHIGITCGAATTTTLRFYDDGELVYTVEKAVLPYSLSSVKSTIESKEHVFELTDCEGYEFYGWVKDVPVLTETSSPVTTLTEVPETDDEYVDLFAVYTKTENYYQKETSIETIKSSSQFIFVAEYGGNYYAMTNSLLTGGVKSGNLSDNLTQDDSYTQYLAGITSAVVTYTDGKITNVPNECIMHGRYSSSNKEWYITNSDGKYMYINADLASTSGCLKELFSTYNDKGPTTFEINGATGVVTLTKEQKHGSLTDVWGLYFTPSVAANVVGTSAYSNIFIVCGDNATQAIDYYTYNRGKIYVYRPASSTYYRSRCNNYTVIFRPCGNSCSAVTVSNPRRTEEDNAGVPLPTVTNVKIACPSMWAWVGWAEQPVPDETTTEPVMITEDPYIPYINNKRLYGVYRHKENGELGNWSSYPQCDPFTVYLYPGTGQVNGKSDVYEVEESDIGSGITLPNATFDACLLGGTWEMAGWRTSEVEYTIIQPSNLLSVGSKYKPATEDEELYAVYRKKCENGWIDLWSTYPMCDKCTLTLDAGLGLLNDEVVSTKQYFEETVNGGITLSSASYTGCSGIWTFCGWSDIKITGGAIVKPEVRLANSQYRMKTINQDTLFAVYRRSSCGGADSIWTGVPNCDPYTVTLYANGRNVAEGAYFGSEFKKEVAESSIGDGLEFTAAIEPTIGCSLRWMFIGWREGSPIERTYVDPTGSLYKRGDSYCIRELGESFFAVYAHKGEGGVVDYWTSNPDCQPYSVKLHPCEGTIDGSDEVLIKQEDEAGKGIKLPQPTANCNSRGWTFAGWALGEELTTTTNISSVTLYAAGQTFVPMRDNLELYAVYSVEAYKQVKDILDLNTTDIYAIAVFHDYEDEYWYTDFAVSNRTNASQTNYLDLKPINSYFDDEGTKYVTNASADCQWKLDYYRYSNSYKIYSANSPVKYIYYQAYYHTDDEDALYSSNSKYYVTTESSASNVYYHFKIDPSGQFWSPKQSMSSVKMSFELGEVGSKESFYGYMGADAANCKLYRYIGTMYSSWPHCEEYTVYFDGCDGKPEVKSKTESHAGMGVKVPNVTEELCDGWKFAGWATAPLYDQVNVPVTIYPAGSNYVPEHNNTTLYAVYSEIKDHAEYEMIAGIDDVIIGGNYVIIYNYNGSNYALSNQLNYGGAQPISTTVISNKITNPSVGIVWNLQGTKDSYVFYNASADTYIDLSRTTQTSVAYLSDKAVDNYSITTSGTNLFNMQSNISSYYLGYGYLSYFTLYGSATYSQYLFREKVSLWSYPCSKLMEPMRWGDGEVIVESLDLEGAPAPGSLYIESIAQTMETGEWDGTYTIKHNAKRGSRIRVKWGSYYYIMTIPYITTPTSVPYIEYEPTRNLAILSNATFVVDHDITLKNLVIYEGGQLIVENGTLTVDTLIMRTEGDQTAPNMILSESASMEINSRVIFHELRIADDRYYFFALPFNSVLGNLTYTGLLSENPLPVPTYYNSNNPSKTDVYFIKYYNGAKRANDARLGRLQNTYWTPIIPWAEAEIAPIYELSAGTGYNIGIDDKSGAHHKRILRFKMNVDYDWTDYEDGTDTKIIPVTPSKAGPAANNNHAGWNLIGNPYLHNYYSGSADASSGLKTGRYVRNGAGEWVTVSDNTQTIPYLTYYKPEEDDYYQVRTDNAVVTPFSAVFVQIEDNNELMFTNPINTNHSVAEMPAYRRMASANKADSILVGITLQGKKIEYEDENGVYQAGYEKDNAGLIISDDYTAEYEIGADLQKMYSPNELHVYTITGGHNLAFNAISRDIAVRPIPVGVTIPETGYYTFKFDDTQYDIDAVERLYLTDYDEGVIVDLTLEDYEFYSAKGNFESRFALNAEIRKGYDVQTDIENGGFDSHPFCYDTDNGITISNISQPSEITVYDMTGKMVYTAKNVTDRISLNVAGGVYNVVVASESNRVVLRCVVRS